MKKVGEQSGGADGRKLGRRARLLARWTAIVAPLCAGCESTPEEPAALEDGKSLWRRVETEHFVVESSLARERRLLEIASEFETLWHAFAAVPVLGMRPPSVKPLVVVLRDEDEYRYLAGDESGGLYFPDTVLGPLILMPPHGGAFEETVIKHELAHFVASGSLPTAPLWLHEGLAQVMETASYDPRKGEILFGSHSPVHAIGASSPLPAHRFMQPWPDGLSIDELRTYYGRSWLLVHYLIDFELQAFLNFIVAIRNGQRWETAWDWELALRRDDIDDTLDRYHLVAKYGLWTVQAHLSDSDAFEVSPVSPADALALRSVLNSYATNPARDRAQKVQAGNQDLQAAHDLDPSSARVRTISDANESAKK